MDLVDVFHVFFVMSSDYKITLVLIVDEFDWDLFKDFFDGFVSDIQVIRNPDAK